MSITDEMREWFINKRWFGWGFEHTIEEMLNRIDAEHEAMLADARKAVYQGYVELPKDADGEYIHIGDVMEGKGYDSITRRLEVEAVGDSTFFAWRKEDNRWLRHDASRFRHYYAPTIENVLRELVCKAQALSNVDDEEELVADFAKRLILVDDAE